VTLAAGTVIGKYVVRRKLAEGGMAEIYLCAAKGPEGFEKEVVIKRIRSFLASDPEFVRMFIAEAQVASRLNHANVVQIFDFDKHEDTYYLAMEYVRGHSLWELRRRCKEVMRPFPATVAARIASEVARGLHHAHGQRDASGRPLGIVHRDVTPHNVLIGFDGAVKLTDFGIAKAGDRLTAPGVLKGKFAYMSPEQARGEPVDARTDVFALGIILWELLTGGRLFDGDSDVAILRAVQESRIAPPARLNPDVPEELDGIVLRALERDVGRRYATAKDLERALGQFVLRHARELDDTDAGAFVRAVFAEGTGTGPTPGTDSTSSGIEVLGGASTGLSVPGVAPPPGDPVPRRTAVLSGPSAPREAAQSADEDAHAPTFILNRAGEGRESAGPGAGGDERRPAELSRSTQPLATGGRRGRRPAGWVVAGVLGLGLLGGWGLLQPLAPRDAGGGGRSAQGAAAGMPVPGADELVPMAVVRAEEEPLAKAPGSSSANVESQNGPTEPSPVTAAPPSAAEAPRPTPRPARRKMGALVLAARPWAEIFVDGKAHGEVIGRRTLTLPAGQHRLRFEHPLKSDERLVVVPPNGEIVESFDALVK
jgi:eukaryotic-like serine/threonine-protein kinase